ncbi:MAG: hypothetical protein A3K23_03815 [Desulfobacca sp. RBG_16_58_9]|nr:MAG: hypothetical protein A3K23_03815 [Desulfobacca sp. RBG_16_58_9]
MAWEAVFRDAPGGQKEDIYTLSYRIYIDEVGNPDLESSDNPNHRFLSLTGVILDLDHVKGIVHPQMEDLKVRYFHHHPDDPVIFHRKEMLNAKPPFEALRDQQIRKNFDRDLLNLIATWDYCVISVCIDKKNHRDTYTIWRYEPYHYCLAVLLEQFMFFLKQRNARGDVMAESRGGKEDLRLKGSYNRLWEQGTDYIRPEGFQGVLTSKQLKVKGKANNIAGLQLADLIAHPSRNEILSEQMLLPRDLAPFAQAVIEILQGKYYQRFGRITGHGKKFLGGQ